MLQIRNGTRSQSSERTWRRTIAAKSGDPLGGASLSTGTGRPAANRSHTSQLIPPHKPADASPIPIQRGSIGPSLTVGPGGKRFAKRRPRVLGRNPGTTFATGAASAIGPVFESGAFACISATPTCYADEAGYHPCHAQPPRRRRPAPTCSSTRTTRSTGSRGAPRRSLAPSARPADLPVDRLRGLPLVPRDGARVVRGRGRRRPPERALRRDQGRPRGAPRPRPDLHGARSRR